MEEAGNAPATDRPASSMRVISKRGCNFLRVVPVAMATTFATLTCGGIAVVDGTGGAGGAEWVLDPCLQLSEAECENASFGCAPRYVGDCFQKTYYGCLANSPCSGQYKHCGTKQTCSPVLFVDCTAMEFCGEKCSDPFDVCLPLAPDQ
jgi:hypothetical protein